jgi:hypothetical protein
VIDALARCRAQWYRCRTAIIIALASSFIAGVGVFVGLTLIHQTDRNATKLEHKADKARVNSVENKAEVAKTQATKTAKTANRARKDSRAVIRYLQGKQGIPGVPGHNGVKGAPGPQGLRGESGAAGRPPTATEVDAAVRRYCSVDGRCAASQSAMVAAITTFCQVHNCRGPQGERGPQGLPGAVGQAGADGDPSPDGFSATLPNGTLTCVGAGRDAVGRPTYTCTGTATSPPPAP